MLLTIYHGSPKIIEKPFPGGGRPYNDYGPGFYCTESIELAKEWACSNGKSGFANCYTLETDGLRLLNLSSDEFTILHWLAVLLKNREVRVTTPISKRGKEYLISNFLPNTADADYIIGYRADDSYFSFARAFTNNEISLAQLAYAMKLGKLGEQIMMKSRKAFDALTFISAEDVDHTVYFRKKEQRDIEARDAFDRELEKDDFDGIFMRDIIREEMKPDDKRLR